ncbi:MAG: putative metal-dependent hydrolase [Marmoricola sp.]|nr:putative metal-dependent hydrolase [Marmoricola sp.]
MTDLVIRKMGFEFDEPVDFNWQPANPQFSVFCNAFTFVAVPFEKYIIKVVRAAQERITDPEAAAEAEAFLRQEAQHSAAHRRHMLALIARYPGLEAVYDRALARYDELVETESVEFNAAYIANLEATFTPLFTMMLNNSGSLLAGGDDRVAGLMTWHFVEEIEHRSSGLVVFNAVCDKPWQRTRWMPKTFRHITSTMMEIVAGFDEHVPEADRVVSAAKTLSIGLVGSELARPAKRAGGPGRAPSMLHGVPRKDLRSMLWHLALSQTPKHDPADQPLPELAFAWMRAYETGADLTRFTTADAIGKS